MSWQQRIKDLRNKMGLTQDDFAKKLKTTVTSVSRWENGKRRPRAQFLIDEIEKLENEYGINEE